MFKTQQVAYYFPELWQNNQ